jgi:integrase
MDRLLGTIAAPVMREKTRLLISALFGHASLTRGRIGNPVKKRQAPSTRASRKTGSQTHKRYLRAEELARLLDEVPSRYRTLVHLMSRVGLRPGEAYALRVGKFDPLKRTPRTDTAASGDTKTGEARTLVLPASIADELVAHIGKWDPDALIFSGAKGAMLIGNNFRRRVFSPAAERAGLPGLRVNDLRHSAVSWAISLGANVYDVQRMVGHSKPSITLDVYRELWDTSQEPLAERMDEAIRAELPPQTKDVLNLSR